MREEAINGQLLRQAVCAGDRQMIPSLAGEVPARPRTEDDQYHVLVVVKDSKSSQAVAQQLEAANFRVTLTQAFGLVELLAESADDFDLMVTAQSSGEMASFGLPQLARSVDADLPILVLDSETVRGTGVMSAVRTVIQRWPLRDRPLRAIH